jgi:hypothetical protein
VSRHLQGTVGQGRTAFCSEMQLSRSGEAAEITLEDAESSFWLVMVGQLVSLSRDLTFSSIAPALLMQRHSLGREKKGYWRVILSLVLRSFVPSSVLTS